MYIYIYVICINMFDCSSGSFLYPDRNVNVDESWFSSSHIPLNLGCLLARTSFCLATEGHALFKGESSTLIFLILNSYRVYMKVVLLQSFEDDKTFPHMNPFPKQLDELQQLACERNPRRNLESMWTMWAPHFINLIRRCSRMLSASGTKLNLESLKKFE